jgi:GAF domain-containing protein
MQIETDVEWVLEIAGHVARGDTLDEALAATVSFAVALVDCDRCFVYVRDDEELVYGFGSTWIKGDRSTTGYRLDALVRYDSNIARLASWASYYRGPQTRFGKIALEASMYK